MSRTKRRCPWAEINPRMIDYHDREWGVPVRADDRLFEFLVLDAFQAGLSWATILDKRENFRRAFDGFDPERIARYTPRRVERLLGDAGIVRNRMKVEATVRNARAFLELREQAGSFSTFVWDFVGGQPTQNTWRTLAAVPARTEASDAMSRALKERGFSFVGSTICYAFMQASGLVNDHLVSCPRHQAVATLARKRAHGASRRRPG